MGTTASQDGTVLGYPHDQTGPRLAWGPSSHARDVVSSTVPLPTGMWVQRETPSEWAFLNRRPQRIARLRSLRARAGPAIGPAATRPLLRRRAIRRAGQSNPTDSSIRRARTCEDPPKGRVFLRWRPVVYVLRTPEFTGEYGSRPRSRSSTSVWVRIASCLCAHHFGPIPYFSSTIFRCSWNPPTSRR